MIDQKVNVEPVSIVLQNVQAVRRNKIFAVAAGTWYIKHLSTK